jgi:hypothetical protein
MVKKSTRLFYMVFVFLVNAAQGQPVKVQQGIIYKQGSNIRLGSVKILNKQRHQIAKSNLYGVFNIVAATGDSLEISGVGFVTVNSIVTDFSTQILYLTPALELPEVTIKENSLLTDLQEVKKGYRDKGVFYTGTPHYYYLFLKPMTFIYENFKSEVINARKFKKYAKREVDSYEVSARFNDDLIKSNVPIKEADLFSFKLKYQPSLAQIRVWNDYDLINYIKCSYLDFKKKHDTVVP